MANTALREAHMLPRMPLALYDSIFLRALRFVVLFLHGIGRIGCRVLRWSDVFNTIFTVGQS